MVSWHFEPESFVPLLRDEQAREGSTKRLHVITDHLGTPRELVDDTGALHWSASYRLWGDIRDLWTRAANDNILAAPSGGGSPSGGLHLSSHGNTALKAQSGLLPVAMPDASLCPIRFQGQWLDEETGLYYNRFRTYDPLSAQYLSPDPIGILGGLRTNGYVNSAVVWVDPLGLEDRPSMPSWMPPLAGHQRQHIIPWQLRNHSVLNRAGNLFDINGRQNLMYLPTCQGTGTAAKPSRNAGLHRSWTKKHKNYNEQLRKELGNLDRKAKQNKWSKKCTAKKIRALQLKYRTLLSTGVISLAAPCK